MRFYHCLVTNTGKPEDNKNRPRGASRTNTLRKIRAFIIPSSFLSAEQFTEFYEKNYVQLESLHNLNIRFLYFTLKLGDFACKYFKKVFILQSFYDLYWVL